MIIRSKARLRFVSIPPRKMRLVADMIRGLPVQRALDILNFTPKVAARHVAKTVKSAAANALSLEGTDALRPEDLVVKTIEVDAAPTAKRIRFQSMGRIFRIRKRFSHLTVVLEGDFEAAQKSRTSRAKTSSRAKKAETVAEESGEEAKPAKRKAAKKRTPKAKPAKAKTTDEKDDE